MYTSAKFPWTHSPAKAERSQRKARRIRERSRLISDACARYDISRSEYEARFAAWCYMRDLYRRIKAADKARVDTESMVHAMKERAEIRAQRRAIRDSQMVLDFAENPQLPKRHIHGEFPGGAPSDQ